MNKGVRGRMTRHAALAQLVGLRGKTWVPPVKPHCFDFARLPARGDLEGLKAWLGFPCHQRKLSGAAAGQAPASRTAGGDGILEFAKWPHQGVWSGVWLEGQTRTELLLPPRLRR